MKFRSLPYYYILVLVFLISCSTTEKNIGFEASFIGVEQQSGSDKKSDAIIEPYKQKIDADMNSVIGTSDLAMPKERGVMESLLGNFVADVVLAHAKEVDQEVDFAVLNFGGLRTSLPKGDITVGNIYELMPFDNEITILVLSGDVVNELFRYIASKGGVPIAGAQMSLEEMNGVYVPHQIMINGRPFDKSQSYKVATSDYLANGGDQMKFWTDVPGESTAKKIRDALLEFIRLQTDQGKSISSRLEGRVSAN